MDFLPHGAFLTTDNDDAETKTMALPCIFPWDGLHGGSLRGNTKYPEGILL
jgi:hypothetical protein